VISQSSSNTNLKYNLIPDNYCLQPQKTFNTKSNLLYLNLQKCTLLPFGFALQMQTFKAYECNVTLTGCLISVLKVKYN